MHEFTHDSIVLESTKRIELLQRAFARLTKRETEVVSLVVHGLSNKEIARQLSTSDGTIKVHLNSIGIKLGFDSYPPLTRTKIAVLAITYGGFKVNDSVLFYIK
jgi:DNA-binding NarL/FixJ family response regulator